MKPMTPQIIGLQHRYDPGSFRRYLCDINEEEAIVVFNVGLHSRRADHISWRFLTVYCYAYR